MEAALRILVTEGTFDKVYDPVRGTLGFHGTHVETILRQAQVSLQNVRIQPLFLKDSLVLTDDDRRVILAACAAAAETRLLITHGTDTATVTARRIAEARLDKAVVLVGAMVPFSCNNSDATFNLGFALAAAQLMTQPGVYIAMHGRFFPWDQVRKNRRRGRFEPTS